eukprot:1879343-Alexandrium_andersonii.AAC.1
MALKIYALHLWCDFIAAAGARESDMNPVKVCVVAHIPLFISSTSANAERPTNEPKEELRGHTHVGINPTRTCRMPNCQPTAPN